jgi:hypothetical protein
MPRSRFDMSGEKRTATEKEWKRRRSGFPRVGWCRVRLEGLSGESDCRLWSGEADIASGIRSVSFEWLSAELWTFTPLIHFQCAIL